MPPPILHALLDPIKWDEYFDEKALLRNEIKILNHAEDLKKILVHHIENVMMLWDVTKRVVLMERFCNVKALSRKLRCIE